MKSHCSTDGGFWFTNRVDLGRQEKQRRLSRHQVNLGIPNLSVGSIPLTWP